MFLIGFLFSHGTSSFFDYGKGRQHFWLSPLDYPPARTGGAVNGGSTGFANYPIQCCRLPMFNSVIQKQIFLQ